MYKGRLTRNLISIGCFLVSLVVLLIANFVPKAIANYTDIMTGTLSFTAIATALLFACFSLIPALTNSKLMNALQDLGTDVKLMDRLLVATVIFFIISLFSLANLFFKATDTGLFAHTMCALWLSTFVSGTSEIFQILDLMFLAVKDLSTRD